VRGSLTSSDDLYGALQVAPNADLEAIHAAYRRLARLYHPDLNPRPEAAEQMRAINAAYRVLSDPRQRAAYDARRFLRPLPTVGVRPAAAPRPRVVVVAPAPPPTQFQRRVDRIVAVLGVLLIIGIGLYAALVIPRAEQAYQADAHGGRPPATAGAPPPRALNGSVPARLQTDSGLRSFPGPVLVPPSSLAPFKDLPIMRLDATSQGIARYAVYYGDVTTGLASISGLIGRTSFDGALPRLPDCAPDATYCAGPGVGQNAGDPPGLELFRPEHLVGEDPAFVTHRVCCNGVFWSLSWYDAASNMSYTIDLSRNVAAQFGSSNADDDVNAAKAVGALAGQLVRLP
jgi:curved DNA-binding protein CbpA